MNRLPSTEYKSKPERADILSEALLFLERTKADYGE